MYSQRTELNIQPHLNRKSN